MGWRSALGAVVLSCSVATACDCGSESHDPGDPDGGTVLRVDAGRGSDAGRDGRDAGRFDASGTDAAGPVLDAGPSDAGVAADGGAPDAGLRDAGCVARTFHRDTDGDGFGSAAATDSIAACVPPPGYVASSSDCDDSDATIHPASIERCDCPTGVPRDEDCDGSIDESCTCTCDSMRSCGFDVGACMMGIQRCVDGVWSECTGGVMPMTETCNGMDDDCDGMTDEPPACPD